MIGDTRLLNVVAGTRLPYMFFRMRVRQWGTLPRKRGPTLVIANHQHEDEAEMIILRTFMQTGAQRKPLLSASTRRMYEPGFFAERMPWSSAVTRRINASPLFLALGLMPIENEISSRPLGTLASEAQANHGDLALTDVFSPRALAQLKGRGERLSDLARPEFFSVAAPRVKIGTLNEPYRGEAMQALRAEVEADIVAMEERLQSGETFFVTPEGKYSVDGRLAPLRGIVTRLAPLADVWLCGVAYDPMRGPRVSMLYRILRPFDRSDLATSLQASRPVTTSALLARWLTGRDARAPFTPHEAIDAVARARASLPPGLFADPELLNAPDHSVSEALATLVQRKTLTRTGETYVLTDTPYADERFPSVTDLLAYHTVFLGETVDAARRLAERGIAGFA